MRERPLVGRLLIPVVVALLVAGLAWVAGLDTGHVVLVGIGVVLVAGASRVLGAPAVPDWPAPVDDTSGTGCHLVPLQARIVHECETDRDRFERVLAPRLRLLAAARLRAGAGANGGDANGGGANRAGATDASRLLGRALFEPLRPGHGPRRPGVYLARLLDRLDEIDPPPSARSTGEDLTG